MAEASNNQISQNVQSPADQQESASTSELSTIEKFDKLDKQYRLAIEFRLLSYPYDAITKKLNSAGYKIVEGTVRHWFIEGDKCHGVFNEMRDIRAAELQEQIKHQKELIERGTANALLVINKVLRKAVDNDEITDQEATAARDMLDRGGIPKQTKNENINNYDVEGLSKMASVIKGVLEQK